MGTATIPSTTQPNGNGHTRTNVAVPVTLSLKDVPAVSGLLTVAITISPATAGATGYPTVSFSSVSVGGTSVEPGLVLSGTTFTANFSYSSAARVNQLDFNIGGYTYQGQTKDHREFAVTTQIRFRELGATADTVLSANSAISL